MTTSMIKQHLARTPVLAGVSDEVLSTFASHAHAREFRRGERLWRAGDIPEGLAVVAKGLIKVIRSNATGRGVLCACFGAPQTVGDAVLVRGLPYPAEAVVATPKAQVIWVPRSLFLREIEHNPKIALCMTRNMHVKLLALHDKIDVLSAGAVESRLATALLKLADQYGDELEDGTHIVPVALSRRELSDWVSTSFETVVRIMKRWERAGVLETNRQGFLIRSFAELYAARGESLSESSKLSAE